MVKGDFYEYYELDMYCTMYAVVGTTCAYDSYDAMVEAHGENCEKVDTPAYAYDDDLLVF